MAWRAGGEAGPAPARTVAGTAALRAGREAWIDLPAGRGSYLLVCVLEDAGGRFHADLGMRTTLTVR